jgi:negative regulator of flagellin synthesis FlgM
MKITSSSSAPKPSPAPGTARALGAGRQSAAQGSSTAAVPTDSVSRLSQLETQFGPSDFNAGKVSQISADIAAGRYQVDAGAVADKLLASTAALAGKAVSN